MFNESNKIKLVHYFPDSVDFQFDMLVESLPTKDPAKEGMKANLYRDENDSLFWKYTEVV
jgi:hypothetical protein